MALGDVYSILVSLVLISILNGYKDAEKNGALFFIITDNTLIGFIDPKASVDAETYTSVKGIEDLASSSVILYLLSFNFSIANLADISSPFGVSTFSIFTSFISHFELS